MDKKPFVSEKLKSIYAFCFMIVTYILTVASFCIHGNHVIKADDCTEWLLADHLNSTHRIVSADWWYGTELHVFFTQLLNKPLLKVFTDWHTAHALSFAIFLLLLVASVLYLGYVLKLSYFSFILAGVFCCPFSSAWRYFGLYSGFYIFYLILLFFNIALIVHSQTASKHKSIILALSVLLSFLAGLNGIRHIIIFIIPLILTEAILLWIDRKPMRIPAVIMNTFACGIAYVINEKFLSHFFEYMTYKNNNLETFSFSKFWDYLDSGILIMGYEGINDFTTINGIAQLFALVTLVIIILSFIHCFIHRNELSESHFFYTVFALTAYISNALIFYMGQQAEYRFMIFVTVLTIPVVVIAVIDYLSKENIRGHILAVGLSACIMIQGVGFEYMPAFITEKGATPEEKVAAFLMANGYTEAVAEFWDAAIIQYWSNGEVTVRCCEIATYEGNNYLRVSAWEQPKEFASNLPDNAVIIANDETRDYFKDFIPDREPIYSDDGYNLYFVEGIKEQFTE